MGDTSNDVEELEQMQRVTRKKSDTLRVTSNEKNQSFFYWKYDKSIDINDIRSFIYLYINENKKHKFKNQCSEDNVNEKVNERANGNELGFNNTAMPTEIANRLPPHILFWLARPPEMGAGVLPQLKNMTEKEIKMARS